MVAKRAIMKNKGFDLRFPSVQDWDMWVRIIKSGYEYKVVREDLLIYHKHERESIGGSPKAKLGYKLFYKKHFLMYCRYFLNRKDYGVIIRAIQYIFNK